MLNNLKIKAFTFTKILQFPLLTVTKIYASIAISIKVNYFDRKLVNNFLKARNKHISDL